MTRSDVASSSFDSDVEDCSSYLQSDPPARDLSLLLEECDLTWLMETLKVINAKDLEKLKSIDIGVLRGELEKNGLSLSVQQEHAISVGSIEAFEERCARGAEAALFQDVSRSQHLVFLSHYKAEAGTEAALMRHELEQAIAADPGHLGHSFEEPIFLDTENLTNLEDIETKVRLSHNLAILLTQGILTRPWCLFEILTAQKHGVRVLLVNVSKPGSEYSFPDADFYDRLRSGDVLDKSAQKMLKEFGYELVDLEAALRAVFQQIAVVFSPHKATDIRRSEIRALLRQCKLKPR